MVKEKLCLVNLSNMDYKYIEVSSSEDYINELNDFNIFDTDVEVQYMDGALRGRATDNILDILKISEEYKVNIGEVGAIFNYFNNIEDTKNIIENHYMIINDINKKNAFIEYLEELDFFSNIPDNIIGYLDYKKLMRDYEIEGLNIIEYGNGYIFC